MSDEDTPSYWVEHLATFAVGPQYGLLNAQDGIRKLKQMERSSAIWAQPMVLRLRPNTVSVEDENGELVEQFPMSLVQDPTGHLSADPNDTYNNILLFVVAEDKRSRQTAGTPTEMHIFQCNKISANDVVSDISAYIARDYRKVRNGRRETGFQATNMDLQGVGSNGFHSPFQTQTNGGGGGPVSYTRTESREIRPSSRGGGGSSGAVAIAAAPHRTASSPMVYGSGGGGRLPGPSRSNTLLDARDDASASSDSSEYFERDVNTLNRCFDDIERFVARIQSAALAQREIEAANRRGRSGRSRQDPGILSLRAQLPGEFEFVDILQKFKLCFNLLAKLKNHIHEPNAPELLHFLFTPLTVILDACQWGLGRNIAPQVVSPLLSREAVELLRNCLTSKEMDVWMALGDSWKVTPEDWHGAMPPPYRPVFADGFMPYGPPGGPPPPQPDPDYSSTTVPRGRRMHQARSTDNLALDVDRMSLEKDRIEFEREKIEDERRRIMERERRVLEEERKIEEEKTRVAMERERLLEDQRSIVSSTVPPPILGVGNNGTSAGQATASSLIHQHHRNVNNSHLLDSAGSSPSVRPARDHSSNRGGGLGTSSGGPSISSGDSPRQRAFFDELRNARAKIVTVIYDRVGQNNKELTVSKGEYLEVMSDNKKWWECRNVHNRTGYVPHTILTLIQERQPISTSTKQNGGIVQSSTTSVQQPLFVQSNLPPPASNSSNNIAYNNGGIVDGSGLSPSSRPGNMVVMDADTPEYIKKRQGKRGEFRYF